MLAHALGICTPFVLTLLWPMSAASTVQAQEAEAIAGQPFGVGKITVDLDSGSRLVPDSPIELVDPQGRALYPAFEGAGVLAPGRKKRPEPNSLTVYFLFRGDGPLELDLRTDRSYRATARPVADQAAHRTLLAAWWNCYTAAANDVAKWDACPPLVGDYLTATLARRLGLDLPKRRAAWSFLENADQVFALMTGAESVRTAAQSEVLLENTEATEIADRPFPKPAAVPSVRLPDVAADVVIEPVAFHVPAECFYLRCGSFSNFLWLRHTIDHWGANIRNLASVRGLDYRIMPRIERQLALRETPLADLLGDQIISDVVILGTDTFLREGAAIGILFEARNTELLRYLILEQRQKALKQEDNASRETVWIAGQKVSLLSMPGNQVRSFHAIDGDYHLITTSRALVERFFEAGRGHKSLGRLEEFRWARSVQPVAKKHTVFVYLSDPFFNRLISPHYRIEMTRRVRAASEIDVVRLAQLAASAEGDPATTVEQLIARGLLPKGFGRRPDGSHVIVDDDVSDSLRGPYGSFLPVPDVSITGATPSEVKAYKEFSRRYAARWQRMDPVIIGITRRALGGGAKERVIFDVHITPYARWPYGILAQWLGAADKQRWANVPGDIAGLQVTLSGHPQNLLGAKGNLADQKYAVGMRDFVPQFAIKDGRVQRSTSKSGNEEVYLIHRGDAEPSVVYSLKASESPDENGDVQVKSFLNSRSWLRRLGDVNLIAANKRTLQEVAPHVKLVEAERPAQGRLWIGDLRESKIAAGIHAAGYVRARKISAGNVYLIHSLMQQLHVPAERSKAVAEKLLGARLVCPLAGEYQLNRIGARFDRWHSTAWAHESLFQETRVPEDFRAAVLDWFAGLSLEMNIDNTALSTYIELDVRAKNR